MNIEIISGSPRHASSTKRLALHLQRSFEQQHSVETGLITMQEHRLPYVENVWRQMAEVPAPHADIARRIFDADGIVLVTPEYNGSYSPALKNFMDHFPKQERKAFGIVTGSPGSLGGIRAAVQLQQLVSGLSGIAVPRMLIVPELEKKFNPEGDLLDPAFSSAINAFAKEFLWLTRLLHADSVASSGKVVANSFRF